MLRLPPPIWTMIFLALTAAASWLAGFPRLTWPPHHVPIGAAIFFAGGVPPIWAFSRFRRAGTELDPASETNRALVTTGPYRLTRNPMYLGVVIIALGLAIWTGWQPMLAAPVLSFLTANFVHIPFEEAKLRRQFGAAYDAYTARVRRWV
jgi:protein-S-isoprenylcysteine O-methyltransferase Ste14